MQVAKVNSLNLSDFSNDDVSGAILIANFGSFKTKNKIIHNSGLDIPNKKFEYDPIGNEYRDKHHYYFLEGKLAFLDSANEWFYDGQYLYLWSETGDGSDLENLFIRAKNQTFAYNFLNCSNVILNLVILSSVIVKTPSSFCFWKNGTTDPRLPKTLPYLTTEKEISLKPL